MFFVTVCMVPSLFGSLDDVQWQGDNCQASLNLGTNKMVCVSLFLRSIICTVWKARGNLFCLDHYILFPIFISLHLLKCHLGLRDLLP